MEVLQPFKAFSTIVFVNTRAHAEEVARFLNHNGFSAGFYHAGLKAKDRERIQEHWIKNQFRSMVATNAFGMGIDKPDVRLVVHYDLPASPEAYFQEAGRAGRDGERAYSVVLFDQLDEKIQSEKLQQSFLDLDTLQEIYIKLCNHFSVTLGDLPEGSFSLSLKTFCSAFKLQPLVTVVGLKALHHMGLIYFDSETVRPDRIKALAEPTDLYAFQIENQKWGWLAQALVRMDGNLFHGYSRIDLEKIAAFTHQSKETVIEGLKAITNLKLFDYQPGTDEPFIEFLLPRPTKLDAQPFLELKKWEANLWKQWNTFLSFCKEENHCRTALLLQYFGETATNCGHCDVCRKKKQMEKLTNTELKENIWKDFQKQRIWGKSELIEKWQLSKNELHEIMEELVGMELIIEREEDCYERR
jgi:ATP-dependent DNA helicase RecQ